MSYMVVKLLPYLVLALAIGLIVGWYSCPGLDHSDYERDGE